MQYDVFKTAINGIKSLDLIEDDTELMVVMAGSTKPVIILNKDDDSVMIKAVNFTSTRFNFGLLLLALSNVYTQGDNSMMSSFKAFDNGDSGIIAKITSDGEITQVSNDVVKDDLQFMITKWLMSDFTHDSIDPLVGLIGLGRLVEVYTREEQETQTEAKSTSETSGKKVS